MMNIGVLFLFSLRMGGLVNNSIIANIRITGKEIQTVFSRKKNLQLNIFFNTAYFIENTTMRE